MLCAVVVNNSLTLVEERIRERTDDEVHKRIYSAKVRCGAA